LQKSEKPSQSVNKLENKSGDLESLEKLADLRQSNNLLEKQAENIGIVKGIQQKPIELSPSVTKAVLSIRSDNLAKMEVTKDRKTPFGQQFQSDNSSSENLLDLYNQRLNNSNNSNSSSSPVTSNGVLKPPAYRNPPAPKTSMQSQKLVDMSNGNFSPIFSPNDILMQNVQYRDLVQLIKYQRDKINTQQTDLTKVSEIDRAVTHANDCNFLLVRRRNRLFREQRPRADPALGSHIAGIEQNRSDIPSRKRAGKPF
jgi:hypothetical protein